MLIYILGWPRHRHCGDKYGHRHFVRVQVGQEHRNVAGVAIYRGHIPDVQIQRGDGLQPDKGSDSGQYYGLLEQHGILGGWAGFFYYFF